MHADSSILNGQGACAVAMPGAVTGAPALHVPLAAVKTAGRFLTKGTLRMHQPPEPSKYYYIKGCSGRQSVVRGLVALSH